MEQCCQHPVAQSESSHEGLDKLKKVSGEAAGPENSSYGFDCNICLDLVQDPVVTFCGHLYCWPCIYRWLQSQKASSENSNLQPQCPVCKAEVSQNTLIPLYGRGQSGKPYDSKGTQLVIPQRPNRPGYGIPTLVAATSTASHSNPSQQLRYHSGYPHPQEMHPYYSLGDYSPSPSLGFAGTTTFHPMIGMFGEMIYARIFGNSQTTLYAYPNTYSSIGTTSSARIRRHVMHAERSLSRMSFFLLCCIILCLLLF